MPTQIIVKYSTDACGLAADIRGLFCRESLQTNDLEYNPLIKTNFNELLDKIAQEAFDEGRCFAVQYPNLNID